MKRLLYLIPFLICVTANAAAPTRQNSYVTQTTIRSDDVTDNEDAIFGYLQTGVDTLRAGAVDAITEVNASLRSGSDQTLVTGTKGTTNQLAIWDANGDIVNTTAVATGNNVTITGRAIVSDTIPGASAGTDLCIGSDNIICKCNFCN